MSKCQLRQLLTDHTDLDIRSKRILACSAGDGQLQWAQLDVSPDGQCTVQFEGLHGLDALDAMRVSVFDHKALRMPLLVDPRTYTLTQAACTLRQVRSVLLENAPGLSDQDATDEHAIIGLEDVVSQPSSSPSGNGPNADDKALTTIRVEQLQQAMITAMRAHFGAAAENMVRSQAARVSPASDPGGFVNACERVLGDVIGPVLARTTLRRAVGHFLPADWPQHDKD